MESLVKQARSAGLLYVLACLSAPFSLIYVPRMFVVPGDALGTASRIRASTDLLRLGIAGELLNGVLLAFASLAFYRLFRAVSAPLARAMLVLILIAIPISFANALTEFAALDLASGAGLLPAFDRTRLDALALLFMRLHGQGVTVVSVFWGLWLFPLGMLVVRSGFIPRIVGLSVMLAGSGYVLGWLTFLFAPGLLRLVSPVALALAFGEVPLVVWLLVRGARAIPAGTQPRAAGALGT